MVKPLTYGRMGNFLFQAAAAMSYAWKHDLSYTLPDQPSKKGPVYLQHLVNPKWDPALPSVTIKENGFPYQELPFQKEWRRQNIFLDGYWQTEKYFKQYRKEILQAFGFKWELLIGTVSVHVRRGDYLRLPQKHPAVGKAWIEHAMERFPGFNFCFFSDDIQWCKDNFGGRNDVSFSEGRNEVEDLTLMSNCEHHICSASTFSWWGVWLNQKEHKKVLIPKRWFVPGWGGIDVRDIVPAEWEKI